MKLNKLIPLCAASMLLAACGNAAGSASGLSSLSSQHYDDSGISEQDPSDDSLESSAKTYTEFPSEEVRLFAAQYEITTAIPSFSATSYTVISDVSSEYPNLTIYGNFASLDEATNAETAYRASLAEDYVDLELSYDEYGYCYEDKAGTVELQFYTGLGEPSPYFMLAIWPILEGGDEPTEEEYVLEDWPTEMLGAFCEEYGIEAPIPVFEAIEYHVYIGTDWLGDPLFEVWAPYATLDEAKAIEDAYMTKFGEEYVLDDSERETMGVYADSVGKDVTINFWADEDEDGPYFCVDIYPVSAGSFDETFDEAKPGETSTIDLTTLEDLLIAYEEMAGWNNGAFSITVEQGDATLAVGGEGSAYLYNPLRVYTGQTISIYSEIAIASIAFSFSGSKTLKEADVKVGEYNASTGVLALSEGSLGVSITVSAQVRFESIAVTFAA